MYATTAPKRRQLDRDGTPGSAPGAGHPISKAHTPMSERGTPSHPDQPLAPEVCPTDQTQASIDYERGAGDKASFA